MDALDNHAKNGASNVINDSDFDSASDKETTETKAKKTLLASKAASLTLQKKRDLNDVSNVVEIRSALKRMAEEEKWIYLNYNSIDEEQGTRWFKKRILYEEGIEDEHVIIDKKIEPENVTKPEPLHNSFGVIEI